MTTPRLLTELLERAAWRDAGGPGLHCRDQRLTWDAYAREVRALARALHACGVRRGDRVGLFLGKSIACGPALFGVLAAGAAYVPIDPLAPSPRVRFIVESCGIRCLIADAGRLGVLRELGDAGLALRAVIGLPRGSLGGTECLPWEEIRLQGGEAPAAGLDASEEDLAYIMFTSGSTGTPKGLMHTHRSGLAFARWAAARFALRPDDRLANHAPLHFDLSTFDYFAAPLAGASTVVVPEDHLKVPASHAQLLAREEVSILYAVPFTLVQLLERGALERVPLPRLRWVLFAGEPMPPGPLHRLMSLWPQARFANLYGPAEVNVCTHFEVPARTATTDLAPEGPVPIGRPCPGCEITLVDDTGAEAAPGQPGELWVAGPTQMTGYWRRPDLDAIAFVERTTGDRRARRFYRTGDLVRARADGELEFLGRRDRQVKTRGNRVELDEVEAALRSHPLVEEAAAVAVPDGEGSRRIAVAASLRPAVAVEPASLLRHLRTRLPSYAVPRQIVIIDALPHTSSGKIDRSAIEQRLARSSPS